MRRKAALRRSLIALIVCGQAVVAAFLSMADRRPSWKRGRRIHSLKTPADSESSSEVDPLFVERHQRWVVIVDDEESIRLAVGDFLYDQGYQVTACADADSMLQLFASSNDDATGLGRIPDAIIRYDNR